MTAAAQPSPLRLGVFGGAFDPPHLAHAALATAAVAQLALDALRIFPTGNAWHKQQGLTAGHHRLAMAHLAFDGLRQSVVDDRELRRAGPTYTIDTLRELKAEHPAAQLFLIMGEDQAGALTQWREWQAILRIAVICVAARPQRTEQAAGSGARPRSSAQAEFGAHFPPEAELRPIHLPAMPESATEVRERLAAGQGIAHLVSDGVARYIEQHHLYQAT